MIRVGILSFSDGRRRVHDGLAPYIKECEKNLAGAIGKTEEVHSVRASEIVHSVELARSQAREIAEKDVQAVLFNVPVFAFPNFSAICARQLELPTLVFAQTNPKLPGLGGMQASVNMIKQVGLKCAKAWGSIDAPATVFRIMRFLRAAYAATSLKGQVYGLFGGRSIGMGSGAVNPDLWMEKFGVDVEHIDQLEIIRRAESISEKKVEGGMKWLEEKVGAINYDNDKLTKDTLEMQVRCYYATKELAEEHGVDFLGVKCHYELSEYYITQCVAAAFFNDPYDWDGPKEPTIYSCEADSDGALTMQIMKLISGKPVLFMDFRHFDRERNLYTLCNCGAMATWYARQGEADENLKAIQLSPVIPKYAGKGCHVHYVARGGEMTFGRLTRVLDRYTFTTFKGEAVELPAETVRESTPVWPHCYMKSPVSFDELIEGYDNNHIHAVAGDYVQEIREFCALKDIECKIYD